MLVLVYSEGARPLVEVVAVVPKVKAAQLWALAASAQTNPEPDKEKTTRANKLRARTTAASENFLIFLFSIVRFWDF